jgi:hypothetical protein
MFSSRINNKQIKSILGPQQHGFIQGEESKLKAIELAKQIKFNSEEAFAYTGSMKHRRCVEYSTLFPEYKLMFIGDNGQGDLIGGLNILRDIPKSCVFIHKIIQNNGTIKTNDEETNNPYPGRLFFFKNYLELCKILQQINVFNENDINVLRQSVIEDINLNLKKICSKRDIGQCKTTKEYENMLSHYFCCEQANCLMPPHCISETDIFKGGNKRNYKNKTKFKSSFWRIKRSKRKTRKTI